MREKLIELLRDVQYLGGLEEKVADYLIANGVTIAKDNNVPSKWIPVTERLPEDGIRVLVAHDDGIVRIGISKGGLPAVMSKSRLGQPFPFAEVTHWMPLPQPPKGE